MLCLPVLLLCTNLFSVSFCSSSPLPVPLTHLTSCPPLSQFSTHTLHSPLTTPLLPNCPLFSSPFSLRFFPCPSVHIISLLGLPALHVVIYRGVALDCEIYPFLFSLYLSLFTTSCCTDFYSLFFVLFFESTSSLTMSLPFTQLHSPLYPRSACGIFYHALELGYNFLPAIVLF
jgi:hypothetical protein